MPLFLLFRNPKTVKIKAYSKNKGISTVYSIDVGEILPCFFDFLYIGESTSCTLGPRRLLTSNQRREF